MFIRIFLSTLLFFAVIDRTFAQTGTGTGPLFGGTTAIAGKYPWMVSVRGQDPNDNSEIHICGAVVIGTRTVLTAAHCIPQNVQIKKPGSVVKIRVSSGAINHNAGTIFTVPASNVFIPSQYYGSNSDDRKFYDLAILILDQFVKAHPIALNDDPSLLSEISLSKATDRADNTVMLGWGRNAAPGGGSPNLLQIAQVPVISNGDCQTIAGFNIPASKWICVTQNDQSVGACKGDSGGPLIAYENGRPYLVGIAVRIFGDELTDNNGNPVCARQITAYQNIWYFADFIAATARTVNRYVHLKSDTFTVGYPNEVVALPLISNHVDSRQVFARNSGLGLNHYWWTKNSDWNTEYFSDSFGIPTVDLSPPAAVIGPGGGNNNVPTIHTFTRDMANGNLHHFYWVNYDGWHRENLTSRPGGLTITESGPVVVNGPEVGNRNVPSQHVFGITRLGFNRLVHFDWINYRGWQAQIVTNDTTNSGPYEPVGLPSPVIYRSHPRLSKNLEVYVRSQEGDLIQLHQTEEGDWRARNLTRQIVEQKIAAGACTRDEYVECINPLKIAGDPVADLGARSTADGSETIQVFAAGPSGNLMHYYWILGSGWGAEDLTLKTGRGADGHIQGRPFTIVGPSRGNSEIPSLHVFARNQAGELIQYFWVNYLGWQFGNLTSQTSGELITSDPVAIIGLQFGNNGVADLHVLASASGARFVHYHWLNFLSWTYRGAASGPLTGVANGKASVIRGPVTAGTGPNFAAFAKANLPDHPRQFEMRQCCAWLARPIGP